SVFANCADVAGNSSATNTVTGINIDRTLPQITGTASPPAPASGWYTGSINVSFTCPDALSGVAGSPSGNTTLSADTNGTTVPGSCTDVAGNTATANVGPVRIDTTPPGIAVQSRTPANGAGWNNGPVTVVWACSDAGSGPVQPTITKTVSTDGTGQSTS